MPAKFTISNCFPKIQHPAMLAQNQMKKALKSVTEDDEFGWRKQCFLVPSICALGDKMKVYLRMKEFGPRMRLTEQQREVYKMLEAERLSNKLTSLNKKNVGAVKKAKGRIKAWKFTLCRMFGLDTMQLQIFLKQQTVEIQNVRKTKLACDNSNKTKAFVPDPKINSSDSCAEVYQLLIAGQYHLKVIATPLNRKSSSFTSPDFHFPSDFDESNGSKGKPQSFKAWLQDRERKIADYERLLRSAKNELRVSAEELVRTVEDLEDAKREKEELEKEISECKETIEGLQSDLEFSQKVNEDTVQKFESLVKQLREELLSRQSSPTLSEKEMQDLKDEVKSKNGFFKKIRVKINRFAASVAQYYRRFQKRAAKKYSVRIHVEE